MPIDFPNSPSVNDTFTSGGSTWIWTGTVWNTVTTAVGATGPTGPAGAAGATGPTGPSAITTQGDLAIGDASGAPTRLGIGANGQVLSSNGTTATWTTPTAGGTFAWVSLASGSFPTTGGVEVDLTSIPAYDKYLLTFKDVSSTTFNEFLRVWINGQNLSTTTFDLYGVNTSNLAATNEVVVRFGSNSLSKANGAMLIFGAQSATHKYIHFTGAADPGPSGSGNTWLQVQGLWKTTAAINRLQMVCTNSTDAGTYQLYGSN